MRESTIEPNERFFLAASHGGPYLVIVGKNASAFQSYTEAEAFARSRESVSAEPVTLARAF